MILQIDNKGLTIMSENLVGPKVLIDQRYEKTVTTQCRSSFPLSHTRPMKNMATACAAPQTLDGSLRICMTPGLALKVSYDLQNQDRVEFLFERSIAYGSYSPLDD